jgi:2-desacetyl-2-hydroxyethyl bacteriochlorophyllide A dehydrogenase
MKALVFYGAGDIRYVDVDTPQPKADEVLIKVKAVSICGSDLNGFRGINPMRVGPLIMGHEFAGEVAVLGKSVTNVRVGDKVGVITNIFCGVCPACKAGLTNICDNRLIIGTTMKAGSYNGAMADYVIAPAAKLFSLSGKYTFSEYSLLEPLSTALRGTKLAGDLKGKTVAVIGCGPIGLLSIMCIKLFGAKTIVAVDTLDKRLEMAKKCGATHVLNAKEDLYAFTRKLTNDAGVDIVFDAVGSASTVNQSVDIACMGGKVIWVGLAQPKMEFEYKHAVVKELNFQSVYLYTTEMEEGLKLLESGKLDIGKIITSEFPMSEGPRIFKDLVSENASDVKVVLTNQ